MMQSRPVINFSISDAILKSESLSDAAESREAAIFLSVSCPDNELTLF